MTGQGLGGIVSTQTIPTTDQVYFETAFSMAECISRKQNCDKNTGCLCLHVTRKNQQELLLQSKEPFPQALAEAVTHRQR